ncbi:hypothetical protein QBC35DRAFT_17219 [Podospora australis]|uniref:Uncharacterized protein n=1 Tax=Podospora australis TaxID=1536484 RepID=A0AAN6WS41_9PEZI|nr:hypothetical protein QBC35DRAFT_17219 [Podospora australis]
MGLIGSEQASFHQALVFQTNQKSRLSSPSHSLPKQQPLQNSIHRYHQGVKSSFVCSLSGTSPPIPLCPAPIGPERSQGAGVHAKSSAWYRVSLVWGGTLSPDATTIYPLIPHVLLPSTMRKTHAKQQQGIIRDGKHIPFNAVAVDGLPPPLPAVLHHLPPYTDSDGAGRLSGQTWITDKTLVDDDTRSVVPNHPQIPNKTLGSTQGHYWYIDLDDHEAAAAVEGESGYKAWQRACRRRLRRSPGRA